jgi:phosphoenolpyruvate carboxylase
MKTTLTGVSGFAKIDSDLNYLMGCLKEVLLELEETKAAEFLPWQEGGQTHDINQPPPRIEQAYSIAFQLLNMVEENASTRTRHLREIEHGLADEPGLWGQQLAKLKAAGVTAEEILQILPEVRVESVLTAHPTEAKRGAVLEQHRGIFLLLASLENQSLTPSQRDEIRATRSRLFSSVRGAAARFYWRSPKSPSSAVACSLHARSFSARSEQLDERLLRAWKETGFETKLLEKTLMSAASGLEAGLAATGMGIPL